MHRPIVKTYMHNCIMCTCACTSTPHVHVYTCTCIFLTTPSFVDVSFVNSIQPMVCMPCLHMHLQYLFSTSVGINTQMQCKCMCMHFTLTKHTGYARACMCGLYVIHGACITSTYASAVFFPQSQAALLVILHSESIHECWG